MKKYGNNCKYEINSLTVGEEFSYFNNHPLLLGKDGALFEAFDESNGYMQLVFYRGITEQEVHDLTKATTYVRLFTDDTGHILILFKYENSTLLNEFSFDPTLYEDARGIQITDNNRLTTICVDSYTGVIKGLRVSSLPLEMVKRCAEAWAKAILNPFHGESYRSWYASLQQKYTTQQLWEMGEDVGYLGQE